MSKYPRNLFVYWHNMEIIRLQNFNLNAIPISFIKPITLFWSKNRLFGVEIQLPWTLEANTQNQLAPVQETQP